MREKNWFSSHAFFMPIFMRRFMKVRGGGGIYERLCLLFGNDINSNLNGIGKEILLMEITKTKKLCRIFREKPLINQAFPENSV